VATHLNPEMPLGLTTGQRTRRPTAWEVSFPDELNEGEVGEAEDERRGQEHTEEQQVESEGGQPFLNGKRKLSGGTNDRVRCCSSLSLFKFDSFMNDLQ
jgi:hypothetical protein